MVGFRTALLLCAALAVLGTRLPAQPSQPSRRLNVRLLAATNEKVQHSLLKQRALADVLPMLNRVFRFPGYRLVTQKEAALREGLTLGLDRGLTMTVTRLTGTRLTVELYRLKDRRKQRLLQTSVTLVPAKPVVLGGLKDADDTTLIVVLSLAPQPVPGVKSLLPDFPFF